MNLDSDRTGRYTESIVASQTRWPEAITAVNAGRGMIPSCRSNGHRLAFAEPESSDPPEPRALNGMR